MFKYRLYLQQDIHGYCTDGRKGVPQQAGGTEHHNITEAAPNELKLGEDG